MQYNVMSSGLHLCSAGLLCLSSFFSVYVWSVIFTCDSQGKVFTEEEDAFLLNMMHRYGYGNWEVIRMEIRKVNSCLPKFTCTA